MKKKILGALLALTTCFSLTGCNKATLEDLDSQIKAVEETVIRGDLTNKDFKFELIKNISSESGIAYRDGDTVYMYIENELGIIKRWFVRKGTEYYEYTERYEGKKYTSISKEDYLSVQNTVVELNEQFLYHLKALYKDCNNGDGICYVEKGKKDVYTFYTKAVDGLDYIFELQYGKILSLVVKGVKHNDDRQVEYDEKYIFTYGEQTITLPNFDVFTKED